MKKPKRMFKNRPPLTAERKLTDVNGVRPIAVDEAAHAHAVTGNSATRLGVHESASMIRKSLATVQSATFCILLPGEKLPDEPELFRSLARPAGTGFFISPDGWFVTAAHVVADVKERKLNRVGIGNVLLFRPLFPHAEPALIRGAEHVDVYPDLDVALMKFDIADQTDESMRGKVAFPYVEITVRPVEDGEPVYAFGYPLPRSKAVSANDLPAAITPELEAELSSNCPQIFKSNAVAMVSPTARTTSAIVAHRQIDRELYVSPSEWRVRYFIDKALNYGNSGGPIIEIETGKAFAVCIEFQPTSVDQPHLPGEPHILMPSLYTEASSLSNMPLIATLRKYITSITDQ